MAPRRASATAIARPMPRDAPVTRATRPAKVDVTAYLLQHMARIGATDCTSCVPPTALRTAVGQTFSSAGSVIPRGLSYDWREIRDTRSALASRAAMAIPDATA